MAAEAKKAADAQQVKERHATQALEAVRENVPMVQAKRQVSNPITLKILRTTFPSVIS